MVFLSVRVVVVQNQVLFPSRRRRIVVSVVVQEVVRCEMKVVVVVLFVVLVLCSVQVVLKKVRLTLVRLIIVASAGAGDATVSFNLADGGGHGADDSVCKDDDKRR